MLRLLLDSRVGLRVLALFVLAAGAPMLLLATLSQRTVVAALNRHETALLVNSAKFTGIQTLERLRVAQQAMLSGSLVPSLSIPDGQPGPLLAVVDIDERDQRTIVSGRRHSVALERMPMPSGSAAVQMPRLRVVDDPTTGSRGIVLILRDRVGAGQRLGLVNPAFLWEGADELPPGVWLCVLDTGHHPLFCPEAARAETASLTVRQGPSEAPEGAKAVAKALFLDADFGAPDWQFVAGADAALSDMQGRDTRYMLPTAAAAGLLLAVLLSLVQIRRTMKPLGQLTAGARELAQRRFGSRLDIRSADEFGELAGAFNDMAARLEAQFSELEALAALDRQIVEHSDLDQIHEQIARQLAAALPDAHVAVAHVDPLVSARATSHVFAPRPAPPRTVSAALEPEHFENLGAAPDWQRHDDARALPILAQVLPVEQLNHTLVLPLRWRSRCFGFIAIGLAQPDDLAPDERRQVIELRNRATIAASAAERERLLVRDARYDGLTGFLNRHGLHEQLQQLIRDAGSGAKTLAALFIDLDRFKLVNDSLGHAAGDDALRAVAARLRDSLPMDTLVARPAGDEFVVILPGVADLDEVVGIAQRLLDRLALAVVVQGSPFFLGASIGIATCSDPAMTAGQLLRSADHAMYQAKRRGGGRYAMHDPRLDAQARRRGVIESELPNAASRGQLKLLYQPRVHRSGVGVTSVEALIRWQHPQHGIFSPAEFIPIAEESELIEHIGNWVIDTACAQTRRWHDQGFHRVRVAINLSARQIDSDRLVPTLRRAVERHGIRPQDLEVEITEGLLVEQTTATVDRLHELRRMGVTVALDDFGTGYSSLSYLRNLPIDIVKVDRSFVKSLGSDPAALAITRAILTLASSLNMRTVVEGIETPQQLGALSSLAFDELQGFLFSPPVDGAALLRILEQGTDWAPLQTEWPVMNPG